MPVLSASCGPNGTVFVLAPRLPLKHLSPTTLSLAMGAHDLTLSEIADLIMPDNHPGRLSAEELDSLTARLFDSELDELIRRVGINSLVSQLPPIFHRVLLSAQRVGRDASSDYGDSIDDLVRNFDEIDLLETSTPPPSSPEPPITPPRPRQARSTPLTPQTAPHYTYSSPAGAGRTISWFQAGALTQGVPNASVHGVGTSRPRSRPKSAAYTIFFGGEIGTFTSWTDVQPRIGGHGIAIFAGYPSLAAADAALAYARARGWTGDSNPPPYDAHPPVPSNFDDNPFNEGSPQRWYVVCRGVAPGLYRSFLECSLNVSGIKGSLHNSWDTREDAEYAFNYAERAGLVRSIERTPYSV
ncbi:hypothetical protein B0H16DRAFT_1741229 [Mycena metata]|uniref:Ribonuclease H1 N-terminal domain-containing protein n=1 Tax=Mycena metata TaxID=1033252 RepID=A0AAD7HBK8_9AGAR|nr:hypothetical protein B0H16DRAFT_1741229 [Mycena metata]